MTNEELAARIRAGEKQYIEELYQRTHKKIVSYAKKNRWRIEKNYPELSFDDLIQCGYLAFVEALNSYDPAKKHDFHGYVFFAYKHELSRLLGRHQVNNELVFRPATFSLNEKKSDIDDAPEKLELLTDECDIAFEYEYKELAELMGAAVAELPGAERDIVIEIYYAHKDKAQIAKERNSPFRRIKRLEDRAFELLSANQALRDYYYKTYSPEVQK